MIWHNFSDVVLTLTQFRSYTQGDKIWLDPRGRGIKFAWQWLAIFLTTCVMWVTSLPVGWGAAFGCFLDLVWQGYSGAQILDNFEHVRTGLFDQLDPVTDSDWVLGSDLAIDWQLGWWLMTQLDLNTGFQTGSDFRWSGLHQIHGAWALLTTKPPLGRFRWWGSVL